MQYRVFVENREVEVYPARVSADPLNRVWNGAQRPIEQSKILGFVSFDMSEPVELCIEATDCPDGMTADRTVELRPREFGIRYTTEPIPNGCRIRIFLDCPRLFSVQIGGWRESLAVFANEPYVYESRKGDLYFGRGVHYAGLICPQSNQRVVLDAGAVVYGVVYAKDVENVTIEGRGILDASCYRRGNDVDCDTERSSVMHELEKLGVSQTDREYSSMMNFYHCRHVTVNGIVLRDAYFWALILRNSCCDVCLDNIKIIGQWRYNADGVDICNSERVVLQNSFVRSFDDSVVVRAPYLDGESGGCRDIVVRNNVLWCDWGKNLEIWSGHKDSDICVVAFLNNYLIHVSMSAISIDTWYGSDSISVSDIVYDGVFVYPDDDEPSPQFQTADGQLYDKTEQLPYEEKNLVYLAVGRIGKRLPNQGLDPNCDCSHYTIEYTNIVFENIVEHGGRHAKVTLRPEHLHVSNLLFDGKLLQPEEKPE